MDHPSDPLPHRGQRPPAPRVTLRYFAAAQAAAGVASDELVAATAGEAVEAATRLHPPLASVVPACSLLLDGRRVEVGEPLRAGACLDVLPPFAGG